MTAGAVNYGRLRKKKVSLAPLLGLCLAKDENTSLLLPLSSCVCVSLSFSLSPPPCAQSGADERSKLQM